MESQLCLNDEEGEGGRGGKQPIKANPMAIGSLSYVADSFE